MAPETKEPQDSSVEASDGDDDVIEDHPETLDYAQVLSRKGFTALDQNDYLKAAECFSRALEIRVAYYGELDQRCFKAYYFYGFALLGNALVGLCPDKSTTNDVSSNVENDESSDDAEDITSGFTDDETEYDTEDTLDNDEEESDLDLAWKILDIARVIVEKRPTQTTDNVHVLCLLGKANCYRGDLETCVLDILQAAHILESLDELDFMERSRLYFNIGSSLEVTVATKTTILLFEKSLKSCCSMLCVLVKDICRYSSTKITLSESYEEVVDASTVPPPIQISTIISAIEEQIASARDYAIMLESKLKEICEVEQSNSNINSDIRGAINALSAKVRKVPENDVSTSTDVKVRHIGKVGGSVKKISVDIYSDSIKSSFLKKTKLGESKTGNLFG